MVVNEFIDRHSFFLLEPIRNIVMGAEHVHKFLVAIFSGSSPAHNIRVTSWVEAGFDFIEIKKSILVLVQGIESLSRNVGTICIQVTENSRDELINANGSISVVIKDREDLIGLWTSASNPVIIKSDPELSEVESPTSISIHDFELTLEANQPFSSSFNELLSESPNDQLVLFDVRE